MVRSNHQHPLAKPSSMRLPTSTSKSLWRGRTNSPLTTFYKWFTLLQIFKEKEGGEHSSYWKQKLAKGFTKTFISISCFSKVVFSAENWGVFIGPKRIQIWAPNFEFTWVSEAGDATACRWRFHSLSISYWPFTGGATARFSGSGRCYRLHYFSSLVGLQTWPKPVRTRAQLAPT